MQRKRCTVNLPPRTDYAGLSQFLSLTDKKLCYFTKSSEAEYQSFKQLLKLPEDIRLLPGPDADLASLLSGDAPLELIPEGIAVPGCL